MANAGAGRPGRALSGSIIVIIFRPKSRASSIVVPPIWRAYLAAMSDDSIDEPVQHRLPGSVALMRLAVDCGVAAYRKPRIPLRFLWRERASRDAVRTDKDENPSFARLGRTSVARAAVAPPSRPERPPCTALTRRLTSQIPTRKPLPSRSAPCRSDWPFTKDLTG